MLAIGSKLPVSCECRPPNHPSSEGDSAATQPRPDGVTRRKPAASAACLASVWDAFELDAFGGPEAEPEPEPGDFSCLPDDDAWEGGWQ